MIVHLNGRLLEAEDAKVSVFDRGFLFGDGVYEGLRTSHARVIGEALHAQRMRDGLAEARIRGFDPDHLGPLTSELLGVNNLSDAFVYWQATRGTPRGPEGPDRPRIPSLDTPPTILGFATPVSPIEDCRTPETKRVALRPDTRWTRGRLKSTSLLGGVLAAIEASELGCDDAIMERDGLITEGTATNVFLSIGGRIVTPSLESAPMLAGVTRTLLLRADPSIERRPVTADELRLAEEVMLTGTKTMVASVVSIDGRPVGTHGARPGPKARSLLDTLIRAIRADLLAAQRPAVPRPSPARGAAGV